MDRNENFVPPESLPISPTADDAHPGSVQAEPGASLPAPSPAGEGTAAAPPGPHGHPLHGSEAEDVAYWRGYHAALAVAAEPAAEDDASPRVRRVRIDGFTGAKQVVFLESIAAGFTVVEAAGRAGISVTTVYNFRNRRAGRAFNIAWEAADRRARRPLADHLRGRSVEGQTDTFRDKHGEIVGTRHRHDNRLAMAILTRLDKKAEAYKEDERLVTCIAEDFEELLDVIEADGDVDEFVESRRPPFTDYRDPEEREPRPDDRVLGGWLQRHRYDKVDPADIDISDLDPADRDRWDEGQWARAVRSGLLDRLEAERGWEAMDEDQREPGDDPD